MNCYLVFGIENRPERIFSRLRKYERLVLAPSKVAARKAWRETLYKDGKKDIPDEVEVYNVAKSNKTAVIADGVGCLLVYELAGDL